MNKELLWNLDRWGGEANVAMKYLKDIKRERKVFNWTLTVDIGLSVSVGIQLPIKVLRESGKPTSAKKVVDRSSQS